MNRYRHLAIGSLCLMFVIVLAACDVPMPGRVLLSAPPSADLSAPVAAVETDGTRHFAWIEPGGTWNQPGIRYYRADSDGSTHTVSWYPTELGEHYYASPDLVVTNSGTAFLAYDSCSFDSLGGSCGAYYVPFPKDWNGIDHTSYGAGVGSGNLTLVGRSGWVYALGVNGEGTFGLGGSRISYHQLAGGTESGDVTWVDTWFASDPSAVIDAGGHLHVAFLSHQLAGSEYKIGYTSNVLGSGDMAAPVYQVYGSEISSPSISRSESDGAVYAAYAVSGAANDSLIVWKPGTAPETILLGPATNWQISGWPALAATGTSNYQVVFSAANSDSADAEIWLYAKGTGALAQVTDDAVEDGQPVVAKAFGVLDYPIYAWRTTWADSKDPGGPCFGDVRVITESASPHPPFRTIFQDKETCANPGYDLAANENRGLGVWLDVRAGSSVLEPFYSTDGTETFIPAIRRQ